MDFNFPDARIEVYSDPRSDEYSIRTIFFPGQEFLLLKKTNGVSVVSHHRSLNYLWYIEKEKLLKMSSTAVRKRLINTEEYHKMGETGMLKPDENVELIHGEIYTMSPIGSKHASVVEQLVELLVSVFVGKAILRVQNPIRIDQWNEPEPDLAILEYRKDRYHKSHPEPADILAVIEVSDITYEYDKKMKLPLYASAGIPVYWIVNLPNQSVEVYSDPRSDEYSKRTIYYAGDEIPLMKEKFEVSDILVL